MDAPHGREIEHEPALYSPETGPTVTSTPDGEIDALFTGEVDRGDDVRDICALRDERRALVDHGVIDGAGLVVMGVMRLDEVTAKRGPETGYDGFIQ